MEESKIIDPFQDLSNFLNKYISNLPCFAETTLTASNTEKVVKVPLIRKTIISPDSYIFTFATKQQDEVLGVPVGHHLFIVETLETQQNPKGEKLYRKYTPTSLITKKGEFDLPIKVYRAGAHPSYPDGGKMTQWLEKLKYYNKAIIISSKVGDFVNIQGPRGKAEYVSNGLFLMRDEYQKITQRNFTKMLMIAGGTGITPFFQIIQAASLNPNDKMELHLIFGNKTEADILMREDLEKLEKLGKLKLHYILDTAPEGWKGFQGYINQELIGKIFPKPGDDVFATFCGPRAMNMLSNQIFCELGHKESNVFKF